MNNPVSSIAINTKKFTCGDIKVTIEVWTYPDKPQESIGLSIRLHPSSDEVELSLEDAQDLFKAMKAALDWNDSRNIVAEASQKR